MYSTENPVKYINVGFDVVKYKGMLLCVMESNERDMFELVPVILNSVGFDTFSAVPSMSDSGEESSVSGSEFMGASGAAKDVDLEIHPTDDTSDSELRQLREAVAKKEAEERRLVEAENKTLRAQLNNAICHSGPVVQLTVKNECKGQSFEPCVLCFLFYFIFMFSNLFLFIYYSFTTATDTTTYCILNYDFPSSC